MNNSFLTSLFSAFLPAIYGRLFLLPQKSVVILLLLLVKSTVFAQDLIVFQNRDSLEVEIIHEDSFKLYMAYRHGDQAVSSFIDKGNLKSYEYDHYTKKRAAPLNHRVKLAFNYGMGYLLGKTPENLGPKQKKHLNGMRTGSVMEANVDVFVTDAFGFGLKYNRFSTTNATNEIRDNITIEFIGATLFQKASFPDFPGFLNTALSFGSVSEKNNKTINGNSYQIRGQTVGLHFNLGVDLLLLKHFSVGVKTGVMTAFIREFKSKGPGMNMEGIQNLGRLDGLIGIKIYL